MAKTAAEIQRDYYIRTGGQPQAEWDRQNTTHVSLKLNNEKDADILAALTGKNKQAEIKRLIRAALATE